MPHAKIPLISREEIKATAPGPQRRDRGLLRESHRTRR